MITKTTPINEILNLGKECKQCGHCCSHGSGFLIGDDLKNIAEFLDIAEKEVKEKYLEEKELFNTKLLRPKLIKEDKPYGKCIFLEGLSSHQGKTNLERKRGDDSELSDNKKCGIHKIKPFQCKVGNCNENGEELSQWFMLNYLVNKDDPESIRQYVSYLKAGGKTIQGGKVEELIPNKEKLRKILNFEQLK